MADEQNTAANAPMSGDFLGAIEKIEANLGGFRELLGPLMAAGPHIKNLPAALPRIEAMGMELEKLLVEAAPLIKALLVFLPK